MSDPTAPPPPCPAPPPDRPRRVGANDVVAPPEGARLLSVGQAAFLLGVSPSTVRRLADEGLLRSVRVLSRVQVSREAVDDFIRAGDTAKRPTSTADLRAEAEAKAVAELRARTRIKADWHTGRDVFNVDKPPRPRPPKAKPAAAPTKPS